MSGACPEHGPQESWEGVCLAVGDALIDGRTVGFHWGVEANGFHWAVCDECAGAQPDAEAPHRWVPLCHECFWKAWDLNGKPEKVQ